MAPFSFVIVFLVSGSFPRVLLAFPLGGGRSPITHYKQMKLERTDFCCRSIRIV